MNESLDPFSHLRQGYERAAEFYDLFASNDDVPLYLEYATKKGSPILDVACGTGRVTFALAKAGFDVYGLESSEAMLGVARRRQAELPKHVGMQARVLQGDMKEFKLDTRFPLIIIPASFGHALSRDEQVSTLNCIHEHLADDGLFILDVFPGGVQPDHGTFEEPPVMMPDGRTITRSGEMRIDSVHQIIEMNLEFRIQYPEESETEDETINLLSGAAVTYDREADLLLRETGFVIVEQFGEFDRRPYSNECGRRILILKKLVRR